MIEGLKGKTDKEKAIAIYYATLLDDLKIEDFMQMAIIADIGEEYIVNIEKHLPKNFDDIQKICRDIGYEEKLLKRSRIAQQNITKGESTMKVSHTFTTDKGTTLRIAQASENMELGAIDLCSDCTPEIVADEVMACYKEIAEVAEKLELSEDFICHIAVRDEGLMKALDAAGIGWHNEDERRIGKVENGQVVYYFADFRDEIAEKVEAYSKKSKQRTYEPAQDTEISLMIYHKIEQEEYAQSPREKFDHLFTMVCHHPRYKLGDEQSENPLYTIAENLDIKTENPDTGEALSDREIMEKIEEVAYIERLTLYNYGGLVVQTSSIDGSDDSSIGYIYASDREIEARMIDPLGRERLDEIIQSEIEEYNNYLSGENYNAHYGIEIKMPDGEIVPIALVEDSENYNYVGRDALEKYFTEQIVGDTFTKEGRTQRIVEEIKDAVSDNPIDGEEYLVFVKTQYRDLAPSLEKPIKEALQSYMQSLVNPPEPIRIAVPDEKIGAIIKNMAAKALQRYCEIEIMSPKKINKENTPPDLYFYVGDDKAFDESVSFIRGSGIPQEESIKLIDKISDNTHLVAMSTSYEEATIGKMDMIDALTPNAIKNSIESFLEKRAQKETDKAQDNGIEAELDLGRSNEKMPEISLAPTLSPQ